MQSVTPPTRRVVSHRQAPHDSSLPPAVPLESRRREVLQLAAAVACLSAWVAAKGHWWSSIVISAVIVGWLTYLGARLARTPRLWHHWGLGASGLPQALRWCAWTTGVGLGLVALYAWWLGFPHREAPPWWSFLLYPLWAGAQEFAVQVIFVSGLVAAGTPRLVVPFVTAAAFGLGHYPHLDVGALAALGGLAWTAIWLKTRNLWPIAVSHALVGGAALVVLLGHNPVGGFFGLPG